MSTDPPPLAPEPFADRANHASRYGRSALVLTGIGILAHIGMSLMEPG